MADGGGAAPPQQDEVKTLRIGMWNARRMRNKMDEIRQLIQDFEFEVFVIIESWLTEERVPVEMEIMGYEPYNYPRSYDIPCYGGILIYLHESVCSNCIENDTHEGTNIQRAVIKIEHPVALDLVAVYNPNRENADTLYELLKESLDSPNINTENVMVLGDFNIDLNPENREICEENKNRLRDPYQLDEHIQSPTLIYPPTSYTDHIYCSRNKTHCVAETKVIPRVISDHYPIFCMLEDKLDQKSESEKSKNLSLPLKCHYVRCKAIPISNAKELDQHYQHKHAICPLPCNAILFSPEGLAKHQKKCKKYRTAHKSN